MWMLTVCKGQFNFGGQVKCFLACPEKNVCYTGKSYAFQHFHAEILHRPNRLYFDLSGSIWAHTCPNNKYKYCPHCNHIGTCKISFGAKIKIFF